MKNSSKCQTFPNSPEDAYTEKVIEKTQILCDKQKNEKKYVRAPKKFNLLANKY